MARLVIKTEGFGNRVVELAMGVNRVGRDEEYEICLDHATVSTLHCELTLNADGIYVHDCKSTNGTFVNGEPILEAWLDSGQLLRIGDVELLVESIDVTIAIPKFERERPKPPVVLEDGAMICPRHPDALAAFKCTHCHEVMCSGCVHVLKIKGGKPLFLCPICSNKCERLEVQKPVKKKGFLGMLQDTVRLKFSHPKPRD